jgi:hypothetical protein
MLTRALRFVTAIAILFAATPAARAQTCGSVFSCTTTPAYTVKSSAAGTVFIGENTFQTNSTSEAVGVQGSEENEALGSAGVLGLDDGPCDAGTEEIGPAGVMGGSATMTGVLGYTDSESNGGAGVAGYNFNSINVCATSPQVSGYLAYKTGGSFYGVYSVGNTGATGTKSFVEPHPTDATKEIRYVSLEGPEAGTYFRGSGRTVNGTATIDVPESFRMVTAETGLTVVVTPVGELAQIAAISKSLDKIVVRSSQDVSFDYMVNGVRKAFQDFQAIAPNDDFVPTGPHDSRFFGLPAESQRRLIATGIFLADGSVNLVKAHEMGWDRTWAPSRQAARTSAAGFLRFAGLTPHP